MKKCMFMVLAVGLALSLLTAPAHSAEVNCKGLAKVHVNVWSYSECSLPLTLHFKNIQAYGPNKRNNVNVNLDPGEEANGPLSTTCQRQATWEGMINFGYADNRNPAYPLPSRPILRVVMAESRWRLTRMTRNGRSITSSGRVLRFKQPRDIFVTIEDRRLTDGTCIDGDGHIACFLVELPGFPDLTGTSTCTTEDGSKCYPRPFLACSKGCNKGVCPL